MTLQKAIEYLDKNDRFRELLKSYEEHEAIQAIEVILEAVKGKVGKPCCGNCERFKNEDINGNGICKKFLDTEHCSNYCISHEPIKPTKP